MATKAGKTANKKSKIVPILGVTFAVLAAVMIVALCWQKSATVEFTPPPFEENAVNGVPEVPDGLGYSSPYRDGMAYRFSVCGNVTTDGYDAVVYLTNPSENSVWLKLRVLGEDGTTLGETGLLRPGQYVRCVTLSSVPPVGTKIKLKIMGYEPETYYSVGAATLNTTMGGAVQ